VTRPLDGVRVVELAEQGFVPSAGAVLADWGADVVKVERPQGDGLRQVMHSGLVVDTGDFDFLVEQINRNKRDVAIDLAVDGGRDLLLRLVARADVFVTNQLPKVLRKFAIEPGDLFAVQPRLVYARGHGQGTKGPDAESGGFDAVSYFSRSGMAHMLAPEGGPLVMQRPGMGDIPSGAILAGGIAAGLLHARHTGRGCVVDVSLFASGLWTMAPDLVATSVLGHEPPKPRLDALPSPMIGPYTTADGRYLMLNMVAGDKYWEACCRALGLDDLGRDPALATEAGRSTRLDEVRGRFVDAIAARPLAELVARLTDAGCVFSVMANPVEVLDDPQAEANGYLPRHPGHPSARLVANPVQFDEEPVAVTRPAPATGEHTDEVLREAGVTDSELAAARAAGAIA
jgi:crotonobetainyl-CoA:carnitine CoA-transferase CaiB-like acyl-CoA transferase